MYRIIYAIAENLSVSYEQVDLVAEIPSQDNFFPVDVVAFQQDPDYPFLKNFLDKVRQGELEGAKLEQVWMHVGGDRIYYTLQFRKDGNGFIKVLAMNPINQ